MKHVRQWIMVFFLVFVLTSCDRTPEDVVEATKEYCQNNPNSAICQGSYLDDLNQTTIETLFEDMLSSQLAPTAYCEQFISVSNLTLYDDCLQDSTSFFPDDIDGYTIDSIDIDTTDTTKNKVTITLKKDARSDWFVFDITLVLLNETIVVEAWDYQMESPTESEIYEAMLADLNNSEDVDAFCTAWFIAGAKPDCVAFYEPIIGGGDVAFTEYTKLSTYTHIKHEIDNPVPMFYELQVTFHKQGYSTYLDQTVSVEPYDLFQPRLIWFIMGLNSVSQSDMEVCGEYLEPGPNYDACVFKRSQIINDQDSIAFDSFVWDNETTLSFTVHLVYTMDGIDQSFSLQGSFVEDGDDIWIDLLLPYEASRLERTFILDFFVIDTNDPTITNEDLAMTYMNGDSQSYLIALREYLNEEEQSIVSHDVVFGSTTFSFTLDNDEVYTYDVTWEYVENAWVMSWTRLHHPDHINLFDILYQLDQYVHAFNTSAATNDYICSLFHPNSSQPGCISLRAELWTADQWLVWTGLIGDQLQFAVYDLEGTEPLFYLYYDMEVMVLDGELKFDFTNERRYLPMTLSDAELVVSSMVTAIGDGTITDEAFCEDYGLVFDDCLTFRSDITAEGLFAQLVDVEDTDTEGTYTVTMEFYQMALLWRELILEVTVYEDLEENPIIMGRPLSDILVPPHEQYQDVFLTFLDMYFDATNSDQDIFDTLNDGMEFEGLYKRDYILTQGITYVVNDITWHADMGFVWYEADVTFTRSDDVVTNHIIHYELFPYYDGVLFRLWFDHIMPEQSVLDNLATMFRTNLTDEAIDIPGFCDNYFLAWEYDNCVDFVSQFIVGEYTVSIVEVTSDDFPASIVLEFTAPDLSRSQLLFALTPIHDIKGTTYIHMEIQHPDQELRNRLSTYVTDGLIYGFGTHGINITTFCDEFAVCNGAFDDITSTVHHLQYVEVEWDFTDYFNPELHVKLEFNYYDGLIETHLYSATYTIDEDGYYIWLLYFIEKVELTE